MILWAFLKSSYFKLFQSYLCFLFKWMEFRKSCMKFRHFLHNLRGVWYRFDFSHRQTREFIKMSNGSFKKRISFITLPKNKYFTWKAFCNAIWLTDTFQKVFPTITANKLNNSSKAFFQKYFKSLKSEAKVNSREIL